MEVRWVNDKMMSIKVVIRRHIVNIVSVYAPQLDLDEEVKKLFWEELDELIKGIPAIENISIQGDFNEHIGATSSGFTDAHGGFGLGRGIEEGHLF